MNVGVRDVKTYRNSHEGEKERNRTTAERGGRGREEGHWGRSDESTERAHRA